MNTHFIGGTIHGRRCKLDFEGVAMLACNHVFCGPGLNEDFEDNSLAGFL